MASIKLVAILALVHMLEFEVSYLLPKGNDNIDKITIW